VPGDGALPADGRGHGERLVLLHGFTQTGRCWGPFADDLAADHEVVTVDLPGHGRAAAVEAGIESGAPLIAAAGRAGTYVGYSMGGRFALRLALDHPEVVHRLVLIGASPGLADAADRSARRAADDALAERLEAIGVAAFVHDWLELPLFAGIHQAMRFESERATNTAAGLASSLRLAGTGAQAPLWDRLGELAMPVLLLTGGGDPKFTAINEAMTVVIRHSEHVVVGGAGHTVHLEAPTAASAALRSWLAANPI
jgi:2-succinyl-6-hydroxy-2,4-cyclohexadiene-1-carboxylate synthase